MGNARLRWQPVVIALLLGAGLTSGCADETERSPQVQSFPASYARAWFDLLQAVVRDNGLAPPLASRLYGYAGVAYYEGVVAGMPAHNSLQGQLNGLEALPKVLEDRAYDWPLVASTVLGDLLPGLLPNAKPASLAAIASLASTQRDDRQTRVRGAAFRRSIDHGHELAKALLAWAQADGYATHHNCAYTPPTGPGLWVPTPPAFAAPLQPCWGKLRPFVLERADYCDAPAPLAVSSSPSSAFGQEARLVYDTVNQHDPELEAIARFWSDDPGVTSTPPGHWLSIVGQLTEQQGYDLATASEAYARLGVAVADAFISCWWTKFEYNYPRPISVIRALIDPAWTTLLTTPPFPEFTSGHSVQSGAAAEVLTALLGDVGFVDHTHAARGFPPRSFAHFRAAAEEAAVSRIYGGIHYREACIVGVTQGECVGREVNSRIRWTGR